MKIIEQSFEESNASLFVYAIRSSNKRFTILED